MRRVLGALLFFAFACAPFCAYAQNVCEVADAMCPTKPPSGTPCVCPVAGFSIVGVCIAPLKCQGTGISGALAGIVSAPSTLTTVGSSLFQTLMSPGGGGGGGDSSGAGADAFSSLTGGGISLSSSFYTAQSSLGPPPQFGTPQYVTWFQSADSPAAAPICQLFASCTATI